MDHLHSTEQVHSLRKRNRHRSQSVRQFVLKKLEFLFGNGNWFKDRFLQKLGNQSSDNGVSIEKLLEFTTIRNCRITLTVDFVADIVSKCSSSIIQLSPDHKRILHRRCPVENLSRSRCTIFVDNIPPNVNREWLESKFRPFGSIEYIHFSTRNTVRRGRTSFGPRTSFAFIEYDSETAASKAVEHFKCFNRINRTNASTLEYGCSAETLKFHPVNLRSVLSPRPINARSPGARWSTRKRRRTTSETAPSSSNVMNTDEKMRPERQDGECNTNTIIEGCKQRTDPQSQGLVSKVSHPRCHDEIKHVGAEEAMESKSERNTSTSLGSEKELRIDSTRTLPDTATTSKTSLPSSSEVSTTVRKSAANSNQEKRKCRRKRKRKKTKQMKRYYPNASSKHGNTNDLIVLSYKSWQELKAAYKQQQRENFSKAKKLLAKYRSIRARVGAARVAMRPAEGGFISTAIPSEIQSARKLHLRGKQKIEDRAVATRLAQCVNCTERKE